MKPRAQLLCFLVATTLPITGLFADPDNPNIDMDGYLETAKEAAAHRQTHRVSEGEFIRLSQEPGAVILDARNVTEYREMHVEGALNLDYAAIDLASLTERLPDKSTPILIYCNNNFKGPVLTRQPRAALNLPTYVALYSYGYRNVYELAPSVDIHQTKLPLVGRLAAEAAAWIQTHRLSEEEFIRVSREPGTVVLDSSTRETYRWLHMADAVNLPRREMDAASLRTVLSSPKMRVLLYENNNHPAFISQREMAKATNELGVPLVGDWSGNVEKTCQVLREYGYSNIYALASYVRVDRSSLPMVAGMSAVDLAEPITLSLSREGR